MYAPPMDSPSPKRRTKVYVAGHVQRKHEPRPCRSGLHEGPLLNTEKYDAFPGGGWIGMGECACCLSTIHRSQLRRA